MVKLAAERPASTSSFGGGDRPDRPAVPHFSTSRSQQAASADRRAMRYAVRALATSLDRGPTARRGDVTLATKLRLSRRRSRVRVPSLPSHGGLARAGPSSSKDEISATGLRGGVAPWSSTGACSACPRRSLQHDQTGPIDGVQRCGVLRPCKLSQLAIQRAGPGSLIGCAQSVELRLVFNWRRIASARPYEAGALRSVAHLPPSARAREVTHAILDGFKKHDLLTYSSAISFQILTAIIPFVLFVLAVAGLLHLTSVWQRPPRPGDPGQCDPGGVLDALERSQQGVHRAAGPLGHAGRRPRPLAGIGRCACGDGRVGRIYGAGASARSSGVTRSRSCSRSRSARASSWPRSASCWRRSCPCAGRGGVDDHRVRRCAGRWRSPCCCWLSACSSATRPERRSRFHGSASARAS